MLKHEVAAMTVVSSRIERVKGALMQRHVFGVMGAMTH